MAPPRRDEESDMEEPAAVVPTSPVCAPPAKEGGGIRHHTSQKEASYCQDQACCRFRPFNGGGIHQGDWATNHIRRCACEMDSFDA